MTSTRPRRFLSLIGAVGVLLAAAAVQAQVTFQGLGDLPGGGFISSAADVSADGAVVVGDSNSASGTEAFRWEGGVISGLGDLPGGSSLSVAIGVSADGAVVVGFGNSASGFEAFRWEGGVMTGLGDLPGGIFNSFATEVSADGAVVVGSSNSASGTEAFRWEGGVLTGLGALPGGSFSSQALSVSADGAVVVGISTSALAAAAEAFRWEGGVMTGLGDLPGGDFLSAAQDVSADGSVVVGFANSASGEEAFRWEGGVMTALGDLPGGIFRSSANGVSADGTVIVGGGNSASGFEAFVWDAAHGMRNLRDLLTNNAGLDLTGWTLTAANAISANGRAIVGGGINPDGNLEGWRVVADAAWTRSSNGEWDGAGNWGYWGPPPSAVEDAFITPENGLTVTGPAVAAVVNTLTIGAQTSGFAELRLQPGGSIATIAGLTIQNRGRLFGSGQVYGPVMIEAGGDVSLLPGDAITFDSPVTNNGSVNVINATLTFPGDGDPSGDSNDGLTNNTTLNLINAEINGDVHSPGGSTINVAAGVVFNGLVSGGANFPGAGLVTFNGGYSPGDSPAVIDISGGINFGSANTLTIELGGLAPGEFDMLAIQGNASLGGTLMVELLGSFLPAPGDVFEILNVVGTLSGEFVGLGEGALVSASNSALPFRISYAGGDGNNVVLTAVPEPSGVLLSALALFGLAASIRSKRV